MAPFRSEAMKPYTGIVHKDADSAYGISFPDAPGCFSAADEMDELFAMAEEALAGWKDPEWEETLAESFFDRRSRARSPWPAKKRPDAPAAFGPKCRSPPRSRTHTWNKTHG
jgi:predicted RNase H-like HicB family nuclease